MPVLDNCSHLWIFSPIIAAIALVFPFTTRPVCKRTLIERGKSMADFLNRKQLLLVPLLSAGFILLLGVPFSRGALLKDIRVGQYDTFTRIVFEFDAHVTAESIMSPSHGQIRIVFPQSKPDLIRKIPIDRSERITDIQIWMQHDELVAVIKVAFHQLRIDSFQLSNPDRIAVDIHRSSTPTAIPTGRAAQTPTATPERQRTEKPTETPPKPQHQAKPIPTAPQPDESPRWKPTPSKVLEETTLSKPPVSLPAAKSQPNESVVAPDQSQPLGPQPTIVAPPQQSRSVPADSPEEKSNGLQYYLMVALIVITIVILILLVFMLVSRRRWVENNKPLDVDEHLQRQDKHIALLNAQIEEQLKRYDEV